MNVTRWLARWRVTLGFALAAVVLWLASPTPRTWAIGAAIALAGEGLRLWAAGHLEKSREVTRSGPYRWLRHPLYAGSALIGAGLGVASWNLAVAIGHRRLPRPHADRRPAQRRSAPARQVRRRL